MKRGCDKKTVQKEWIERKVVEETKNLILNDATIEKMINDVLACQQKENTTLPLLRQNLADVEKSIANMLDAIQQGVFTTSTKHRLEELEAKKEELGISIAQEQIQKPLLSREQLEFFFSRFKDGDIDSTQYRKHIIDIFVNAVYLCDDKMLLVCNYKEGTKTVTFDIVKGSDLASLAPPESQ